MECLEIPKVPYMGNKIFLREEKQLPLTNYYLLLFIQLKKNTIKIDQIFNLRGPINSAADQNQ